MTSDTLSQSALGRSTTYASAYDATLLYPILRVPLREELGLKIGEALPFYGVDLWNAYEVSWLNLRGKPQIGLLSIAIPADSPYLIESKSLKLYLNSLQHLRIARIEELTMLIQHELNLRLHTSVQLNWLLPESFAELRFVELSGVLLDRLDIEVDGYVFNPALLNADQTVAPIQQTLVSHIFTSNCPVTNQPDWASIQIEYVGAPIHQENLLRYLIGFRGHKAFHEQCVEQIFMDVLNHCRPQKLSVYARFTRRGGIDINPWRTNFSQRRAPFHQTIQQRLARQ